MENDSLKDMWNSVSAIPDNKAALQQMLLESKHPVLQRIRKQIVIEVIAFVLLLLVYNDVFDGNRKPVYANVLLWVGLLLVIVHHIAGYFLFRQRLVNTSVKAALEKRMHVLRQFGVMSVGFRLIAVCCWLLFFVSVIKFTPVKYALLAGAALALIIQLVLLGLLWKRRVVVVKKAMDSLLAE